MTEKGHSFIELLYEDILTKWGLNVALSENSGGAAL